MAIANSVRKLEAQTILICPPRSLSIAKFTCRVRIIIIYYTNALSTKKSGHTAFLGKESERSAKHEGNKKYDTQVIAMVGCQSIRFCIAIIS